MDISRLSFLINAGIDNLDYFIKPNMLIETFITSNSKIGISSYFKQYERDDFYKNEMFFSYKYFDNIITLRLISDYTENDKKYFLSSKFNF